MLEFALNLEIRLGNEETAQHHYKKDARYLVVGSVFTVTALLSCVLRLSGNADTIGQKQVMVELYVLENVPRPRFHKECSFFPTCHLCKANNIWQRLESENADKLRCVWLLPKQRHMHRFSACSPSSSPVLLFTIYSLLCKDGICQFIGMVLNRLRRWIVTYKPDLL